jgi:lipopolysaccharide/colanic/teichoic acid biosynthesis glycosyltransferase
MLKAWDELPKWMQCSEVKEYYDILKRKSKSLWLKRIFDIVVAAILLIILSVPMLVIAVMIKADSKGPVLFRQERVTVNGKKFCIHKFRTMVDGADKTGTSVTVDGDNRITNVGYKLRDLRLDEIPQLFDVLVGNMSFVGTRPEVAKYVKKYTKEMRATLLLPAGVTSEASIRYKDEKNLLDAAEDVDKVYMEEVLPEKMKYNLESIRKFSFAEEIVTMFRTLRAVLGKEYK